MTAAPDPAAEFGRLLAARLGGRPLIVAARSTPEAPAGPRLPAPNMAQGGSALAGPPPLSGLELFGAMLQGLGAPRGDGGWRQVLP